MKYAKINLTTGLFMEDVITDEPTDDLIATPCTIQCYWPKWDFATQTWVEGGVAPEPSTEPTAEEIAEAETKVLIAETLIELGVLA